MSRPAAPRTRPATPGEILHLWEQAFIAFKKAAEATELKAVPGHTFDHMARMWTDFEKIITEATPAAEAASRRYRCTRCGSTGRASKRNAGNRKVCMACENFLCGVYAAISESSKFQISQVTIDNSPVANSLASVTKTPLNL